VSTHAGWELQTSTSANALGVQEPGVIGEDGGVTILVDPASWPRHDRLWCHLVSDMSLAELHGFAQRLGIPRRGFDRDHYDVPEERRSDVIAAGAIAVSSRELVQRLNAAGLRRRKGRPSR
jgi:hypothetical protein